MTILGTIIVWWSKDTLVPEWACIYMGDTGRF